MDEEGRKRLRLLESRLEVLAADVLLDEVSAEVSEAPVRLVLHALDVDACCCGRVGLGSPAVAEERLTFASRL